MLEFLKTILDPVQLIGYIGMACALISYQCKKNRNYFFFQTGCSISFALQFLLLASWGGMLLNMAAIFRGVIYSLGEKCRKPIFLIIMEALFAIASIISVVAFHESWWIAIILFIAQGGGTLAMWTHNGKTIRYTQFFVVSPLWIINNVIYFSVGGILCEVFNMLSVIVSFIRFRKTGFDKS